MFWQHLQLFRGPLKIAYVAKPGNTLVTYLREHHQVRSILHPPEKIKLLLRK